MLDANVHTTPQSEVNTMDDGTCADCQHNHSKPAVRARAVAPAAASQLQESAVLSEFAPVVGEWMSLQGVRWSVKHPIQFVLWSGM